MSCPLKVREFDGNGKLLTITEQQCPSYLDWMDIDVKAYYFRLLGHGSPNTKYCLLESQGQQLLIAEPNLEKHDFQTLKEKKNGIEGKVGEYAREHGYDRTPRNQ